jgi:hypothetical protein
MRQDRWTNVTDTRDTTVRTLLEKLQNLILDGRPCIGKVDARKQERNGGFGDLHDFDVQLRDRTQRRYCKV